jgi:hypothetical protein
VDLVGGWFRRLVGRSVGRESSCRALWGSDFQYYSTSRKGHIFYYKSKRRAPLPSPFGSEDGMDAGPN